MTATTPPDGQQTYEAAPAAPGYVPLHDPKPFGADRRTDSSFGSMETIGDGGLSSWSDDSFAVRRTGKQVQLQLAPDCPVVIGRWEDELPPYLDPSYRPTRIVPGTGQAVVRSNDSGRDVSVSRAHFMLRGNAGGIVLTNGVPHVGGGIRPPVNGTQMLQPIWRPMDPGEEYLIEHGANVSISLPNGTVVRICAE